MLEIDMLVDIDFLVETLVGIGFGGWLMIVLEYGPYWSWMLVNIGLGCWLILVLDAA